MRISRPQPSASRLRAVTAVCAALALLGLAACGSDDDSSDDTTADAAADGDTSLDGRAFVSTSVEGQDLVEGSQISITFDDGSLAMYAGCNTAVGAYTLTDGTLTVGPMSQTRMACEDALMAQDTWILAMLEAGPTVTSDGDNITIEGSGTTIELAADNGENAANPLDGSRWRFETLTVDGKMTARRRRCLTGVPRLQRGSVHRLQPRLRRGRGDRVEDHVRTDRDHADGV